METTDTSPAVADASRRRHRELELDPHRRLRRRLRPLYLAAVLQGVILWVPVEKLFLSQIGFDAGSIGIMAASYAAVVPFLEIPSGILADRWSRRGVLMIAGGALMASELVGGLSTNVATYLVAALLLGVFFAMQSGTVDSIIYDTVLEELGTSDGFEAAIGRLRTRESVALVGSALAGATLAAIASPRVTYFATIPFGLASLWVLRSFREPGLHQADDRATLRGQIALTYRTILGRGGLLPIIATMVLTSVLLQALLEFGPLWMVAMAAPAFLYGPQWAGLTSAFGLGATLAGRLRFNKTGTVASVVALMLASSLFLTANRSAAVIIVAQVTLAVLVVAVSTFLTGRLHDGVASTIRAGVASGVSTLTWIVFLPFALGFGAVSDRAGIQTAGWMVVALTALTGVALVKVASIHRTQPTRFVPGSMAAVELAGASD